MTQNLKISIALGAALVLALVVVVIVAGGDDEPAPPSTPTPPAGQEVADVIRDDTHRLNELDNEDVVLVEFLDFECESCGVMFPIMEDIRLEYSDRVTFAIRYFPLDSHPNAMLAAQAAEAGAQQGAFEQMYVRLFQTQGEWGHNETPQDEFFIELASELGLDTEQFEADLHAQATIDRVLSDRADGESIGVQSTPTFFVGDRMIGNMLSPEEIRAELDAALGE